jgi:hypothetical protein
VAIIERAWKDLRPMFSVAGAAPGMLSHAKIEEQRTEMDSARVKRAQAGKAGGEANGSKCKQMQANASTLEASASTVEAKNPSSSSSSSMSKSSSTAGEALAVVPVGAPPAPHGAARLADLTRDMMAKIERGELRREHLQ